MMLVVCAPVWAAASPTVTTLSVAPGASVSTGTVLTFTATVTSNGTPLTAGLVKFCDMETATYCEDSSLIGSIWLTRSGSATLSKPLSYGNHRIQAVFQGTNLYSASSSSLNALQVLSGTLPTTASIIYSNYLGYSGLNEVQTTVAGSPTTAIAGTVAYLDTSNDNYSLTTSSLPVAANGFSTMTPVGGTVVSGSFYTVAGDFNNDGNLDFAVASNATNTAQCFLGNGDGTFTLASTLTTTPAAGASSMGIHVADFNGDGNLDLAILNSDNTVSIYLGNGDGTFTLKSSPVAASNYAYDFTIADFNGDGIPDLAVIDNAANTVAILLGNGDGTFTAQAPVATGNGPESIVAANFTLNGIMDLAIANQSAQSVTMLLGNGNGTFTAGPTTSVSINPSTLVVGDFNRDGIPDLAVGNMSEALIELGTGTGSFNLKSTVSGGASGYGMATADFNGDGIVDLLVGGGVYLGSGTGTFTLMVNAGGSGNPISIGDFNGDGWPDLITPVALESYPYTAMGVNVALEQSSSTVLTSSMTVLGPGSHNVIANYKGSGVNAASESSPVVLTGAQITSKVTLTVSPGVKVASGTTVQVTAAISPSTVGNYTPTGTMTFKDGSTVIGTGTVGSGQAVFSTNTLSVGSHTISASYGGDTNFLTSNSSSLTLSVTAVVKTTPVITWAAPAPVPYGTPLSATQLNATASVAGTFTYNPPAGTVLAAGTQTLSVSFTPTNTTSYNNATGTTNLTVNPAIQTISVTAAAPASAAYNSQFMVAATASSGLAVSYRSSGGCTNSGATFTMTSGSAACTVTYSQAGNSSYSAAFSVTSTTTPTLAGQAALAVTGVPVTAQAYGTNFTVGSTGGSGTGSVTFAATGACSNTGATVTMTSGSGTCSVTATKASDSNYTSTTSAAATVGAIQATAVVTLSNLTQTYSGAPEPATVSTVPTGLTLTFSYTGINGTSYGPSTTAPTNPGSYQVAASVVDPNYIGQDIETLTINQLSPALSLALLTGMPEPSTYGYTVYFELSMATSPCPTGQVQFYVDGSASGSPVVLNGASCTSPVQFQTATLTPGPHSVYAVYSGDTYYLGDTSAPVSHGVTADSTSVTLATSGMSVNVGQPVTFTATVTPAPPASGTQPPAGTVEFLDGGLQIGTGTLSATAPFTATYTTSSLAAGPHSISANFVDSDGDYVGSSSTVAVQETVNLIVPVISWPNPADIVYGTALGSPQLNATASDGNGNPVSGTFVYAPVAGTILPVGPMNLTATFTPDDSNTYASNSASATINVNPAALTVTADSLSRSYGANNPTFTYQITGLVNSDPSSVVGGAALCSTAATTTSPVAGYPINCSQGTLAASNYTFQFVGGTLTVTQATPTLTWTAPAAISYGTALSGTQLDASSGGVAGAFVYTPAAGAVLTAGSQTLSVTFTPTDLIDYATATATVSLTINPASQTIAVGTPAPVSAAYNGQFTVAATASSGLAVAYTSSGGCTNSGATYTMTSATTACSVLFNQAGNNSYNAASQVTETVTATTATQAALNVTGMPTTAQAFGATFTVGTIGRLWHGLG